MVACVGRAGIRWPIFSSSRRRVQRVYVCVRAPKLAVCLCRCAKCEKVKVGRHSVLVGARKGAYLLSHSQKADPPEAEPGLKKEIQA